MNALREAIIQIWNDIPTEYIKNLINSMKRRCLAVIKAKGGVIDY